MNTDIAYIVSHGFAARMVTQTNLLGQLVKEGKRVALICPDKSDQNLKTYCENEGIDLYEFNPESSFWTAHYADIRKYFLEDIETNVALKEKHIYATKYNKSLNPIKLLKPRLAYIGYKFTKKFPIIRKWYKAQEEKHLISYKAEKLITEINPKVLVSTYPVSFSEAKLLKVGNNRMNTKTVIHLLSWDNITCKGHFPQLADEYIAWGPIMKEELIEYYNINKDKIHICGVPHFDVHYNSVLAPQFKKYLVDLGLNPQVKYLFFGMSSPRFAPHEIDIVEKLATWVTNNAFGSKLNLLIRPHPQNVQGSMSDLGWVSRLENIKSTRVAVDFPTMNKSNLPWSMHIDDMTRLSQLLLGSEIVLNSGSTLSIDALCLSKPIILTSFDGDYSLEYWKSAARLIDYPHLNKLNLLNAIKLALNYKILKKLITLYLKDPKLDEEARQNAIYKFCFFNEGQATNRVRNILLDLVS